MSAKDSRQDSYNTSSLLVDHYRNASHRFLGVKPYVPKKLFPLFAVFEDDLRELSIPSRDYAYTVIKLLAKFVKDKGWKSLPVKLFLSDYGIKRYKSVASTSFVVIDTDVDDDRLFQDEMQVARLFIYMNITSEGDFIRLGTVVEQLRPLLSKEWLEMYEGKSKRPDVVDNVAEEFGIRGNMTSYLDIVEAIRG